MADYMTCTALTDAGPFVTRLLLSMPEDFPEQEGRIAGGAGRRSGRTFPGVLAGAGSLSLG